jgi:hypothetical protein
MYLIENNTVYLPLTAPSNVIQFMYSIGYKVVFTLGDI